MTTSLKFYADAGLVAELSSLDALFADDGSTASRDYVVYIGSVASGKKLNDKTNPGVSQITLSIADTSTGSGASASMIRLALSAGGLDAATPGAALDLGVELLSGQAGALPVYLRMTPGALAQGSYTDLTLQVSSVIEAAV